MVLPVAAGVSADKKFAGTYRLMWQVPYQPGTLKAVAYQGGKPVATDEVRTAGAPAQVRLTRTGPRFPAMGRSLIRDAADRR
jgi:beta-galactosidase